MESLYEIPTISKKLINIKFAIAKMFEIDLQDEGSEENLSPVELKNELSTKSAVAGFTPIAISSHTFTELTSNSFENALLQLETSLDKNFYKHNANQIKLSILAYLKHCLDRPIDDSRAFQDGVIFCFQDMRPENEQYKLLESIILRNQIITLPRKKQLLQIFREYDQLRGLFQQMLNMFGLVITSELVSILDYVMEIKLPHFKGLSMVQEMEGLIPRMERFWYDEYDETITIENWRMNTNYDYDQIRKLALNDIESIASTIYFSTKLKYLVLTTSLEMVNQINILDKFISLVSFVASTFLFTAAGISQKEEDVQEFYMDLHYKTAKDGKLQEESLTKRVKNA